ncbi:hypothetical protein KIH79_12635, partial [Bifidobacterium sp. 82T10]|nr:hypothetical protein [Bifidobacterium miconis]
FAHNTGADLYGDTTVHRLSKGGEHFYTADAAELKVLTSKLTTRGGWSDEGRLFEKADNDSADLAGFTVATYKALGAEYQEVAPNEYAWVFTDSDADKVKALEAKAADIAAQLDDAADPIITQIHRLYNKSNGDHVWTSDETEYNALAAKDSWNDEGIAFYVPAFTGTTAVTRLYKGSRHLLSTDSNEQKVLSKKYGWKVEGTVFKAY